MESWGEEKRETRCEKREARNEELEERKENEKRENVIPRFSS
jgi:hypothetical protein